MIACSKPAREALLKRWILVLALLVVPAFADEPSAIEFDVTVPKDTKGTVHIALDEPLGGKDAWAPDGLALEADASGHWKGTLPVKAGTVVHWKVTRGDWDTVEKGADGGDVANRETK